MSTSIRFIAEYYNTEAGEVLELQVLRSDEIKKPMTIERLWLSSRRTNRIHTINPRY